MESETKILKYLKPAETKLELFFFLIKLSTKTCNKSERLQTFGFNRTGYFMFEHSIRYGFSVSCKISDEITVAANFDHPVYLLHTASLMFVRNQ